MAGSGSLYQIVAAFSALASLDYMAPLPAEETSSLIGRLSASRLARPPRLRFFFEFRPPRPRYVAFHRLRCSLLPSGTFQAASGRSSAFYQDMDCRRRFYDVIFRCRRHSRQLIFPVGPAMMRDGAVSR